jgi:predicted Zn-dependent protease
MISRNNDSNDGSSYEKAIVIEEKSEKKGVDAEYAWLRQNYPGCRVGKQALNFKDKKPYDILTITTAEGETRQIYFDISNFFGKF